MMPAMGVAATGKFGTGEDQPAKIPSHLTRGKRGIQTSDELYFDYIAMRVTKYFELFSGGKFTCI